MFGLLGVAGVLLGLFAESTDPGDSDLWRLGTIAFGAGLILWPHLVRVELHEDYVLLRGVLRTRVLPLAELAHVEAGEAGLAFLRHDGGTSVGSGLVGAKAPLASWLGRRVRGDLMAAEIMAAARRTR